MQADKYQDATNTYWNGNKKQAIEVWKELAEQEDARAQYDYSVHIDMRKKGNKKKSNYWLEKSVEQNYAKAQHAMSTLLAYGVNGYKKDIKKANELLVLAADQNYPPALSSLAGKYSGGENGFEKNGDTAKKLYGKAFRENLKLAKAGDPEAQLNLAQNYYHGLGVKKDLKEAKYWFQTAKKSHEKS